MQDVREKLNPILL